MARRLVLLVIFSLLLPVAPARAVEYRLQVVSLWDNGFNTFVKPGELGDGATGPGLEALIAALDRGDVPRGPIVTDRTLRWGSDEVSRAFGAVKTLAEIIPGAESHERWDSVRWNGKPGDRSVWVVEPRGRGRPQQLYRVVLKATGPARQFIPDTPGKGQTLVAVRSPLDFIWFHERRGDLWAAYLSGILDLRDDIAIVAGANSDPQFPDAVRILVSQTAQPTSYKAVLVWRQAPTDFEAPAVVR